MGEAMMETGALTVYQCKECNHIVSDSSVRVSENGKILVLTDATIKLGPEQEIEIPGSHPSKVHPVQCHCNTVLGAYCKIPPAKDQQFREKYVLDGDKLLRRAAGNGFTKVLKLNEKIKNLNERLLDLNYTVMLSAREIVRVKEVLCLLANDPKVINLLQLDSNFTDASSDTDNM
ncbi:uncharacterized protein LOC126259720 [Schistocerca nitens]|uniref:uncharacterized protein LOC126259720 n=1 Tax=Schistocerca nitens TaxID=7011 RepID=UPI002117D7E5|nr:uncharacterized protein LOC126259720 [Schistocerca nitens]